MRPNPTLHPLSMTIGFTAFTMALLATFVVLDMAPARAATADAIIESSRPGPYTELETDRPGKDYKNFDIGDTPNFNVCDSACNSDATCKAWTYVKPGVQGAGARCWLKTTVPQAFHNECCVSGLKPGFCDSGWYWDDKDRKCRQRIN